MEIIYVSAKWCSPCKLQEKELNDLKTDQKEYKIKKLDKDKLTIEQKQSLKVKGLPLIIVLNKEELVVRLEGFHTAEEILEKINKRGK
jgi:thiol:disulfide interchange protein